MSTDIKLSKNNYLKSFNQMEFLVLCLANSWSTEENWCCFGQNNFTASVIMTSASAIDMHGRWVVKSGKGITFSNEYMYDIIRIIKSLGNSDELFDGVSERLTHEMKKQKVDFLVYC